jgi:hypothetical protein
MQLRITNIASDYAAKFDAAVQPSRLARRSIALGAETGTSC